jgi:hypothetical protein
LFDFNSLPDGANNAAVQTYFNTIAPGLVTVYGAVAEQDYSGDGHAVRQSEIVSNGSTRFITLGTTDGATSFAAAVLHTGYDTFIRNIGGDRSPNTPWGTFTNGSTTDKFVLKFSVPSYSISFDWEVFPDGACNTCGTSSSSYPDFELWAGLQGAANAAYVYKSVGTGGDFPGIKTYGTNSYPQGLGHFQADFATPVTRVEFVDWPATIGIDRLDPVFVPEPQTLSLMGLALAGLGLMRRRNMASLGPRVTLS